MTADRKRINLETAQGIRPSFQEHVWDKGLAHQRSDGWTTEEVPTDFPEFDGFELTDTDFDGDEFRGVYRGDGIALYYYAGKESKRMHFEVCAVDRGEIHALYEKLRERFPKQETKTEVGKNVVVNFWTMGKQGPGHISRIIDIIDWDLSTQNYPSRVREKLVPLMAMPEPTDAGRLLLWTGVPGTGKTYALRALADQWRQWCQIDYIVDPDNFFTIPAYMLAVLLMQPQYRVIKLVTDHDNEPISVEKTDPKWKLIVCEDTGELLAADAKERTGQGLGRLLNVTDGLVGQGLKNMILVTTNEELGKLHPAVTRPGRCLANVKFEKFQAEEAGLWLQSQGHNANGKAHTLAELYATVRGEEHSPELAEVGFRP